MKYIIDDFYNYSEITKSNLLMLISDNKNTEYGKLHNFDKIKTVEDFKKAVPISTYEDFANYVKRTLNGEKNVTSVYPYALTLLSSGTTGERKKIVLSEKALEQYADYVYIMPYVLTGYKDEYKSLHTNIFRTPDENGTIISIAYFYYLRNSKYINDNTYIGGLDLLFNDYVANIPYIKMREALSCPEMFSIQSVFAHEILHLYQYLEENWQMLVDDIENDSFSVDLSAEVQELLLKLPKPNKEWLEFLRSEFEKGFDTPIIPRIWKNLKFMVGIGGDLFKCQVDELKKYSGDIPLYNFLYALSECIAGVADEFNQAEYVLLPKSAFFEFLPRGAEETLSEKEIKVGESYELILTNFSGLYRYRTGDLILITDIVGESPKFKFIGRVSQEINIAGEKISASVMVSVVNKMFDELGITPSVYSVGIEMLHYALYLELDSSLYDESVIAECFDKLLREGSPDYDDIRMLGNLDFPVVHFVSQGSHTACMDAFLPQGSQKKLLLFLDNKKRDFLNKRIITNGN